MRPSACWPGWRTITPGGAGERAVMSRCIGVLIFGSLMQASAVAVAAEAPTSALWTSLLQRHVTIVDGGPAARVDDAGMRHDQTVFDQYTRLLSRVTPAQFQAWTRPDQMAFLINAYNAFTIQLVLTRWPRLASIKDIGSLLSSPWKQDFFTLLGRRTDLDHVEALLRTTRGYDDPRIHFAPNCASIDCPMLRNEAYAGDRLDSPLDDATRRFPGDRMRNRYDPNRDTLQVSKIFDWYADDFRVESYRSEAALMAAHAAQLSNDPQIQARIRAQSIDIAFLPYDWHLNAVGTP